MTLGNMRANGVRTLAVWCSGRGCHHSILDVSKFSDDVPVPSFGPRMVCTVCGAIGAHARPNWNERAATFANSYGGRIQEMKCFLPLLLGLLLAGCYSDQKQQLSACQLRAEENNQLARSDKSRYVERCMRAHGYEIAVDTCPDWAQSAGWVDAQKNEPTCYEPMGSFGKQSLRLEKWLGVLN
jgi:hypothetical protein